MLGQQYSVLKCEWIQTTPPEAHPTHQATNGREGCLAVIPSYFSACTPLEGHEVVFLMSEEQPLALWRVRLNVGI